MNWTLKGDSPKAYLFAIANGRRRRCSIDSLLTNGVKDSDQSHILPHVVDFFSSSSLPSLSLVSQSLYLFGMQLLGFLGLAMMPYLCLFLRRKFGRSSNLLIPMQFGPKWLLYPFFRKFWPQLRPLVCKIIQGFCLGTVGISRLNYPFITLIPKVKGADLIS